MDQKTSILIESQVPDFILEEYPLFIDFLKAYYEFLENKQGIQLNDTLEQSKKLSTIIDIDSSIDDFKVQFFNTFANYFPEESNTDPAFLIKNILPLYKAKGSEESFKFLFKLLFGESVDIYYPGNNILIASDGKWQINNSLKVSTNLFSYYAGDGETNEFTILKCICPITSIPLYRNLNVYIDGILQTEFVDYYVLKEYYKIIFYSAPSNNSNIKIFYENIDQTLLINRKIVGKESGASAIIESVVSRILNGRIIYELFVDSKNVIGEFKTGEDLDSTVLVNDNLVSVGLNSISELKQISIVNPGSRYNVGDLVIINSPDSQVAPKAVVSRISKGGIKSINILDGGAGFQLDADVFVNGFGLPFADITVSSLLTDSEYPIFTANTFTIFENVISTIDIANTTINSEYAGFANTANANSIILNTLTSNTYYNIGQISGLDIGSVSLTITSEPLIKAESAKLLVANTEIDISSFGSLGKLEIINPGEGYEFGNEVIIQNHPENYGFGAYAEITEVDENGGIRKVEFVPDKITGSVNVQANSVIVAGISTLFNDELVVGNQIKINNEIKTVVEISSNTSLNVDSAFSSTASNKYLRLYGKNLLGGQGYEQDKLPTILSISSQGYFLLEDGESKILLEDDSGYLYSDSFTTGKNGQIEVVCIMGFGDEYDTIYENKAYGSIEEITITNHGEKIITIPEIDLSKSGDGQAIASPILINSYEIYPGKWINDDGKISSYSIRLQNRDYYNKYSYVLSSTIEFVKYKEIIKNLLHPSGLKIYSNLNKKEEISIFNFDIESYIQIN